MESTSNLQESAAVTDPWARIAAQVCSCMQCGTCTGSCPNAFAMDYTPRSMWRLVLTGRKEDVFRSRTFSVCSSCYTCMLRCPRGLPLTEVMAALKRLAVRENHPVFYASAAFYSNFLNNVEKRGRVAETEFLMRYFLQLKNPLVALRFAPLGVKLLRKGKIHIHVPFGKGSGKLRRLFSQVRELEDG